jgi:hypothetical protein
MSTRRDDTSNKLTRSQPTGTEYLLGLGGGGGKCIRCDEGFKNGLLYTYRHVETTVARGHTKPQGIFRVHSKHRVDFIQGASHRLHVSLPNYRTSLLLHFVFTEDGGRYPTD